jgi:hypothetical protein
VKQSDEEFDGTFDASSAALRRVGQLTTARPGWPVRSATPVKRVAERRAPAALRLATGRVSSASVAIPARMYEEQSDVRVAIIAPPWVPVPPPAYGGTEAMPDNLARGLQRAGHEVLL